MWSGVIREFLQLGFTLGSRLLFHSPFNQEVASLPLTNCWSNLCGDLSAARGASPTDWGALWNLPHLITRLTSGRCLWIRLTHRLRYNSSVYHYLYN
ncbi:unnamed protein product [Nezara viridula]|uniref:Uncharacterized protein n=1 Tax=Nezara viridula TaxID=85310 RepID=A0A9P0MWA3_NEZVI|nr:unnamed protein product [Nezara viridula]